MTLTIAWVVLAVTVTVLAMLRRAATVPNNGEAQVRKSGKVLAVLAIVYSLVLIVGFVYIGVQSSLGWIK